MPYRDYRDDEGRRWEVWAVPASLAERRAAERRRRVSARPVSLERRRGGDRRVLRQSRVKLSSDYRSGWLVFESPPQKRRLTPIPADWERFDDRALDELRRTAKVVQG